jgi:hypothetical protein
MTSFATDDPYLRVVSEFDAATRRLQPDDRRCRRFSPESSARSPSPTAAAAATVDAVDPIRVMDRVRGGYERWTLRRTSCS